VWKHPLHAGKRCHIREGHGIVQVIVQTSGNWLGTDFGVMEGYSWAVCLQLLRKVRRSLPVEASASRQRRHKDRIQLAGTAAGLWNSACSTPKDRLSWDGVSLPPFHKHYPGPGGGPRTIQPHFIAALGQRPPWAGRRALPAERAINRV